MRVHACSCVSMSVHACARVFMHTSVSCVREVPLKEKHAPAVFVSHDMHAEVQGTKMVIRKV